MRYNYNQIRYLERIGGGLFGVFTAIAAVLIFLFSPQNFIYIILLIFFFAISIILLEAYLLLVKNDRISKLFVYVMPLFIIVLLYFALIASMALAPQNFPFLAEIKQLGQSPFFSYFPYAIIVVAVIIEIPIIIKMESIPYETYFTREKILAEGITAKAKILVIKDNGLRLDGFPIYKITMELQAPNQSPYQLTKDLMIPDMDLSLLKVGQIVDVKIDPQNKNNVYFDTWSGDI